MRLLPPARIGLSRLWSALWSVIFRLRSVPGRLRRVPRYLWNVPRYLRSWLLRPRDIRPGKALLAVLVVAGAAVATGGPAHADISYAPTPKLPAIANTTLGLRYALNRQALLQAATEADTGGDAMRAHTLR